MGSGIARDLVAIAKEFVAAEPRIKFAYLFGSMARQTAGPLSDLNVAVYLDSRLELFSWRLRLMTSLAKALGSEKLDLVVLNKAPVVLRYEIIRSRVVLKEDRARRILFETNVLQEYLDSVYLREVQASYLKESFGIGTST